MSSSRRSQLVREAGNVVWLQFDPEAGHEQAGRRPAVVLSPASYNCRTGLLIACPTTTPIKNYPLEAVLVGRRSSVALADQVKRLDWPVRRAVRKTRVSTVEVQESPGKAISLIAGE